jgi:hypothetical protein
VTVEALENKARRRANSHRAFHITMASSPEATEWRVFFLGGSGSHDKPLALIILNQHFSRPLLDRVWRATSWHACADGGANHLYDTLGRTFSTLNASHLFVSPVQAH